VLQHAERRGHAAGVPLGGHARRHADGGDALLGDGPGLGVLLHALAAVAAAEAGVAHAAHRRVERPPGRAVRLVDVHGAAVDAARDLAAELGVLRPDARVQAVLGVVRACDRVVVGLELEDRGHRAERLLAGDSVVGRHVREHRRRVAERSRFGSALATREHRRASLAGRLDVLLDLRQVVAVHERPHLRVPVERGVHSEVVRPGCEPLRERVGDSGLDVDALEGQAELPGTGEAAPQRTLDRPVEVGVVEHDEGVLSAEFERRRDQSLRRLRRHRPTRLRAPREPDEVHALRERRADRRAFARHHLEQPLRQPGLAEEVAGEQRGERRRLRGLQDHCVARDERRQRVRHRERQRVVPRRDDADNADRPPMLDRPRQQWERARPAPRRKVLRGVIGVVPRRHRHVQHLLERVPARLPVLHLHRVEQRRLLVENHVVQPPEHVRTRRQRPMHPRRPSVAGALDRRRYVLGRRLRHRPHHFSRERRTNP